MAEVQKTLTIAFDEPISFGPVTFTEVTLREPTSDEYDQATKHPGYGVTRHLLVTVGKMTAPTAAKVPLSKVVQADAFFAQFLRLPPEQSDVPEEPEPPQEGDAELFAAMELREPTVAEIELAGAGMRGVAKLVSLVTGMPFRTALRMPRSVATRADAYFAGFETPSPPNGAT